MAVLQQLDIHNFRNIAQARLSLSPGVNLIFGDNGSGKTSVLESIHLLSRGRSFRSHMMRHVIRTGEQAATVHGKILQPAGNTLNVGVSRDRQGGFEFRMGQEALGSAAALARALPLQMFTAASFQLIEGSPQYRRQFVDWGVFHVEHGYSEQWRRYQRVLRQRNSLLRRGKIRGQELDSWDGELVQLAGRLHRSRQNYLALLLPRMEGLIRDLSQLQGELEFEFHPGWDVQQDLRDVLRQARDREMAQGQTLYGPHRADLRVRYLGLPAAQSLSRGQTKAVVYGMKVSQGLCYQEVCRQPCLFLLDDFPAELDDTHRQRVVELLEAGSGQLVVTGTHRRDLLALGWSRQSPGLKMFHVEQGAIVEQPV